MRRARLKRSSGWLLGTILAALAPSGFAQSPAAATPAPAAAVAPGTGTAPATPAAAGEPHLAPAPQIPQVVVETNEPRFVAPTRRDRIGRIWAPVMIDGKGPFRLALDTGASHSAIIPRTAQALGVSGPGALTQVKVTGFTGSAVVPSVTVDRMQVGDIDISPYTLPIVPDVFGGADGVLGYETLADKRIYADFGRDKLTIARSRGDRVPFGFEAIPLKLIEGGLLVADIRVGGIRTKAIIDTGSQGSVGNLALLNALMRHLPNNAKQAGVIGVTLEVQKGDDLPAPPIQMGALTIEGVHIVFGDMYLFQHWRMTDRPTMVLGMDLLGTFEALILDYRTREMMIELR
jgi:Aspartyl protease